MCIECARIVSWPSIHKEPGILFASETEQIFFSHWQAWKATCLPNTHFRILSWPIRGTILWQAIGKTMRFQLQKQPENWVGLKM